MVLWAKYDETKQQPLKEHSEHTQKIAEELLEKIKISKTLSNDEFFQENKTAIERVLLKSALLHDVGKADQRFQDYLLGASKNRPLHPLLSLPILKEALKKDYVDPLIESLAIISVASHHTPFYEDLYNDFRDAEPQYNQEITNLLDSWGYKIDIGNIEKPYKIFKEAADKMINVPTLEMRQLFTYFQGILMRSDYYESSDILPEDIIYPTDFLKQENINEERARIQKRAEHISGNLFITLPTGFGKTETALYWAKNNKTFNLFYILPTTSTINAMWDRLKKYYFNENVGFYHSQFELLLSEKEELDNSLIYKYFLKPINITTPDQLILTLMNYKRYTLKENTFSNAAFIFDEIHTYDAHTFFLIKYLLKYMHEEYNIPICIMSATFPDFFKEELSFLNPVELLSKDEVKKEYSNRRRTQPIYEPDKLLTDPAIIERIIEGSKKGRVLVVANTVGRSQDIYHKLEGKVKHLELFHGRFIWGVKSSKEKSAMNPPKHFVLVATQVVEVSLDIDYDVLFTEIAPVDSLVQRFGRINRNREEKSTYKVYIYNTENEKPYSKRFLDETRKIFERFKDTFQNEHDYLLATNEFYNNIKDIVKKNEENKFEKIWRDFLSYVFSARLDDTSVQRLIKTRGGFINIPAIPNNPNILHKIDVLNTKIQSSTNKKEKLGLLLEKRKYFVNVPSFLTKYIENDIVHLEYDDKLGLIDKTNTIL